MSEIKISREDKIKALELQNNYTTKQLNDQLLDELYNKFIRKTGKGNCYIKKSEYIKIENTSEKYKVVILFLNDILTILGKQKITEITEFIDIKRSDLIKDECKNILKNHLNVLIEQFGKSKLHYSQRNDIDTYILTVLRKITTLCGYNLQSKTNQKRVTKEGKILSVESWLTYTIF